MYEIFIRYTILDNIILNFFGQLNGFVSDIYKVLILFFLLIEKSVKLNARLNETPAQTQTHLESDKETKI